MTQIDIEKLRGVIERAQKALEAMVDRFGHVTCLQVGEARAALKGERS